jgi:hypothetical protein
LIRSATVTTRAVRERYCGYRAWTPSHGIAWGRRPSSRWQVVHLSPLPTYSGRESRVAARIARPRRAAFPIGVFGKALSARGPARRGTRVSAGGASNEHAAIAMSGTSSAARSMMYGSRFGGVMGLACSENVPAPSFSS